MRRFFKPQQNKQKIYTSRKNAMLHKAYKEGWPQEKIDKEWKKIIDEVGI